MGLVLLSLALSAGAGRAAETQEAVIITVEDASAKVGEKTAVVARIAPREGYKIADNYRNRITTLSAADGAVEFRDQVVRGTMQDGSLLFRVQVTPGQPGAHAINGIIRFAVVSSFGNENRLEIKSAPLIATVTGTE